mgnify:CR=1 FL=1
MGFCTIGVFRTVDLSSVATLDKLDLYTNFYNFPRPVNLRSMYIETAGQIASSNNFSFAYDVPGSTGNGLTVLGGTITSVNQIPRIIGFLPAHKTYSAIIRNQNSTENDWIKRIIVHYDYAG